MYDDGPAPLNMRFQINSASLDFLKKEWFSIPETTPKQRREEDVKVIKTLKGEKEYQELLDDEKMMGLTRFTNRRKSHLEPIKKKRRGSYAIRSQSAKTEGEASGSVKFDIKGGVKSNQE